jgi:hypothetical protein
MSGDCESKLMPGETKASAPTGTKSDDPHRCQVRSSVVVAETTKVSPAPYHAKPPGQPTWGSFRFQPRRADGGEHW